jgi:hypothetical protein
MNIDNIPTSYRGGTYDPSQSQMSYLNYDINATTGSLSTEYFDLNSENYLDPPLPTWANKLCVYMSSDNILPDETEITIDLQKSVKDAGLVSQENPITDNQVAITIINASPPSSGDKTSLNLKILFSELGGGSIENNIVLLAGQASSFIFLGKLGSWSGKNLFFTPYIINVK